MVATHFLPVKINFRHNKTMLLDIGSSNWYAAFSSKYYTGRENRKENFEAIPPMHKIFASVWTQAIECVLFVKKKIVCEIVCECQILNDEREIRKNALGRQFGVDFERDV